MNSFVDDRGYSNFDIFPLDKGQINLGELHPNTIKAFHRHENQTDYWFCVEGDIMVNLVDEIDDFGVPAVNMITKEILSSKIPKVLEIKPGTWHGYKTLGNKPAKLLYFVTNKYNPKKPDEERCRWDKFGKKIWNTENK